MNLKNEEARKLAKELARRTGEPMTTAITEAVRARLDRVRLERRTGLAERLIKIGRDCAARLREPFRSADHAERLYDEKGLCLRIGQGNR